MPPKLIENMFFINIETGEEFQFQGNTVSTTDYGESDINVGCHRVDSFCGQATFTIDAEDLDYITPTPDCSTISELSFETTINIQRRTHRKRRINKKWLKRYGYIKSRGTVKMDISECHIYDHEDGMSQIKFNANKMSYEKANQTAIS